MMRKWVLAGAALALAACGDRTATPAGDAPTRPAPAADGTAAPAAGPAVRAEVREFRDWRAACDNGNDCVAWTGSDDAGWVRIGMEAGPGAAPTVTTGSWAFGDAADSPGLLRLRIDGKTFPVHPGPENAANAAAGEARAREIIADLASARAVGLSANNQSAALPASGASAALLWIDERQGRLETTTALLRKGDRPATVVPAAPPLPVVRRAPPIAQTGFEGAADPMNDDRPAELRVPAAIEGRPEVRACRAENNEYLDKAVLAARLDAATVLWGVPCGSGAYNATYVLYLAGPDGSNVRPADLPSRKPVTEGDIGGGELWLVNPVYDPKRQTLTVFPRGRGLGDCGTITTWTWTTRGFALTEERFMGDCRGMTPDHWPTTWRADVRS